MDTLQAAVGPRKPNRVSDVRLVQKLLNMHSLEGAFQPLKEDGIFGRKTEGAIVSYQLRVLHMVFPDGTVEVFGGTYDKLAVTHPSFGLVGEPILGNPGLANSGTPSQAQYQQIGIQLGVESRVLEAIVSNECGGPAFDNKGRPVLRFEPVIFSRLTQHIWDVTNPDVSKPHHLVHGSDKGRVRQEKLRQEYGSNRDHYPLLNKAAKLDLGAALQSASYGKFQIMGFNYRGAGFSTVEAFVRAMCRSVDDQLAAFAQFVLHDSRLQRAMQKKDWDTIAIHYNGSDGVLQGYATRLQMAYKDLVGGRG